MTDVSRRHSPLLLSLFALLDVLVLAQGPPDPVERGGRSSGLSDEVREEKEGEGRLSHGCHEDRLCYWNEGLLDLLLPRATADFSLIMNISGMANSSLNIFLMFMIPNTMKGWLTILTLEGLPTCKIDLIDKKSTSHFQWLNALKSQESVLVSIICSLYVLCTFHTVFIKNLDKI
uniref:Leucine-rich repeat-containing N-terminal plant-type domain-containing protein n=1 Tax=Oryza glumipatula TaxID=40148 RepID=A0A0E0BQP9_9ORYZ